MNVSPLGHALFLVETAYFCKTGFLAVAVIKGKCYMKIGVKQEIMAVVSALFPRFEKLCRAQLAYISSNKLVGLFKNETNILFFSLHLWIIFPKEY